MSATATPTRWTPDLLTFAQTVLGRHHTYDAAIEEMATTLGQPVNKNELRGAFGRHGLQSPCQYLADGIPPVAMRDTERMPVAKACELPDDSGTTAPVSRPPVVIVDDAPTDLERILFIPDCHHPFVDRRAWDLLLRAARAFKPHRIVILGDFADFYSVSFHSKDPRRVSQLDTELAATNAALDELDAIPGVRHKHFVEGNHENRLDRYLADKAPALLSSFSVRDLFRLTERGWTFTAYRDYLKVGKLYCTHEIGQAGANAHRTAGASFEGSVCIGHTHRIGVHYFGNAHGESHVANMFGWLGSAKEADYMHRVKAERDWHLGFGLGWMRPSGIVHTQAVPIIGYTAVVDGQLIS